MSEKVDVWVWQGTGILLSFNDVQVNTPSKFSPPLLSSRGKEAPLSPVSINPPLGCQQPDVVSHVVSRLPFSS